MNKSVIQTVERGKLGRKVHSIRMTLVCSHSIACSQKKWCVQSINETQFKQEDSMYNQHNSAQSSTIQQARERESAYIAYYCIVFLPAIRVRSRFRHSFSTPTGPDLHWNSNAVPPRRWWWWLRLVLVLAPKMDCERQPCSENYSATQRPTSMRIELSPAIEWI